MKLRSHTLLRPRSRIVGALATIVFVFGVLAAATFSAEADAATTGTTLAAPAYANSKTEAFATAGWWKTWDLTTAPWHSSVVAEGTARFLRVSFPAGSHNGTSFDWMTGDSDSAHIQYRVRLSPNWKSDGGKLPGFGQPTYNADGSCSGGCGLAPADGITSWTARGHINANNAPGSYLYTPGHTEWAFQWSTAPALVPGRWYTIDYWVTMNTPGLPNGVLKAAVDGVVVQQWTNMVFRLTNALHVNKAWFGFYYGGASVPAQNMYVDIDDITVEY